MSLSFRAAYAAGRANALQPHTGMHLIKPIINLNGSEADALITDLMPVISSLTTVMDQLVRCAPHGRDYQFSPPGEFETAQEQHIDRMRAIAKCLVELQEIVVAIKESSHGA